MELCKWDFPFNIMDVVSILGLRIRRWQAEIVYTDCPFCGDNRGKMSIHSTRDVFRCHYCGEYGGMLALYARVHGISGSDAYSEISEALRTGGRASEYRAGAAETPTPTSNSELANEDEIHRTLSSLLEMLPLSVLHRENLHRRGLNDEQIGRLGYKSTPPPGFCRPLTERLVKQGCTVQGIPGFYLDDSGKWTVRFCQKTAGLLIPARGIDGLIRGAQVRLDVPIRDKGAAEGKSGTKYLWLSSASKHMGTGSGSPVHFVGDPFAKTVYVTEGFLKADIAHCLMNRSFAATAGANNIAALGSLFDTLAENGTALIVEAQDMDKYHNKMVEKGAARVRQMAREYGMEALGLNWNPEYKGIDDWQLALRETAASASVV